MPKHQRELGLKVTTLESLQRDQCCRPGADHRGEERTAVCCLSSLNLETWDEWHDDPTFIEESAHARQRADYFHRTAPDGMARAQYSALRERSVGLGVMGFHSFLQAQGIPFESAHGEIVEHAECSRKIRRDADAASVRSADERGACPDARSAA